MGLDMTLYATLYTSKYALTDLNEKLHKLTPEVKRFGNIDTIEIKKEIGYWRKVNHVHKWFVDNCQNGDDNCGNYFVGREQLEKLLDICKQLMKNKEEAKQLLPVQEGFFFGTYEYDEWYFEGIAQTIEIIETCLELPEHWDFEYHSSW